MPRYTIPEQFKAGFVRLANLNEQEVQNIALLLKGMPVGEGPQKFHERLTTNINVEGSASIASSLYSIGALLTKEKADENLVLELVEAFKVSTQLDSEKEIENLKISLLILLPYFKNLKTTFKAFNVIFDNERIFEETRIITDIRLVFNDDISNSERMALISHQLKVHFRENDSERDMYFSLNTSDLLEIRACIDRALEKEHEIIKDYTGNLTFITITE